MYEIGDYVVHMTGGVCKVEKIAPLEIASADKNRLYYYLSPETDAGSKVFVPTDNDSAMRKVMTSEEILELLDEIPNIGALEIENEKLRETRYKEAVKSCDLKNLTSLLKVLHERRTNRFNEGKRNTATDDRFYKAATEQFCSEVSFVLKKERSDTRKMLEEMLSL